jgi:hypothetical protein
MDQASNLVTLRIISSDCRGTCAAWRFRLYASGGYRVIESKSMYAVFAPIRRSGVVPAKEKRHEIT